MENKDFIKKLNEVFKNKEIRIERSSRPLDLAGRDRITIGSVEESKTRNGIIFHGSPFSIAWFTIGMCRIKKETNDGYECTPILGKISVDGILLEDFITLSLEE